MSGQEQRHLDPEQLVAFEEGRVDDEVRARIEAHLERCGRCAAERALAREYLSVPEDARLPGDESETLEAAFRARLAANSPIPRPVTSLSSARPESSSPSARPVRTTRSRSSSRRWGVAALVAAGLALIILGRGFLATGPSPEEGGDTLRASQTADWAQALEIEALEDGARRIGWPAVDGVAEYRVYLLDDAGQAREEWTTGVAELRIEPAQLPSDVEYLFVRVEYTRADGEIQRSATRTVP